VTGPIGGSDLHQKGDYLVGVFDLNEGNGDHLDEGLLVDPPRGEYLPKFTVLERARWELRHTGGRESIIERRPDGFLLVEGGRPSRDTIIDSLGELLVDGVLGEDGPAGLWFEADTEPGVSGHEAEADDALTVNPVITDSDDATQILNAGGVDTGVNIGAVQS
jgi:hypothetical protein